MDAELKLEKRFAMRAGLHCLFSGLYHILERVRPEAAVQTDEANLYFETCGLNLEYNGDMSRVWLASQQDIADGFARAYALTCRANFEAERDAEAALQELREAVGRGHTPLIFIRTTSLDYHEVFRNGEQRNHIVLLHDWDEAGSEVRIADTSFLDQAGRVTTYEGPLELAALRNGLCGYVWFEPDPDANRMPLTGSDRFQMALGHIRAFLQDKELPGLRFQGLLAYRRYVEDFAKLPELGDAEFSSVCRDIYYCFRVGGIVHQLDYLVRFVAGHAGQWSGSDELLTELDLLYESWRKALMQLYKVGLTCRREKIGQLQERFAMLLDEQEDLLRKLLANSQSGERRDG